MNQHVAGPAEAAARNQRPDDAYQKIEGQTSGRGAYEPDLQHAD